jgi:hypothetical protein
MTPSTNEDHLVQNLTPFGTKIFTNLRPIERDIISLLVYLNGGLLKTFLKVRLQMN